MFLIFRKSQKVSERSWHAFRSNKQKRIGGGAERPPLGLIGLRKIIFWSKLFYADKKKSEIFWLKLLVKIMMIEIYLWTKIIIAQK